MACQQSKSSCAGVKGEPREVEGEARVSAEPLPHFRMLVGGVVVEDHVHDFSVRHLRLDGVEEADKLLVTMALHAAANDLAFKYIESGEQRRCATSFCSRGSSCRRGPSSAEPKLRSPGDIANDFWQRLDPIDLMTTDARLHSVSPGAFDQCASGMGVPGLGDAAASDSLAARLLARDQAEIGHELARVCKACEIAHFSDPHHGCDQSDTPHRLQGIRLNWCIK